MYTVIILSPLGFAAPLLTVSVVSVTVWPIVAAYLLVRLASHLLAPARVLKTLLAVKVIAVNVPSEFLLTPRVRTSLFPLSILVVVCIVLSPLRVCARRVSDGVILDYGVSERNRYRPWNLKNLKDFWKSPFRLGFCRVSEVGIARFFANVLGYFAGVGLGQQVGPVEWRAQSELLSPFAHGLDLPPVGVGDLLHGQWLFHDWIRLPIAIPKRNSGHGRGKRSWKAHTSHVMTATKWTWIRISMVVPSVGLWGRIS